LLPNFKQVYGESLKDAWVRINKMNNQAWMFMRKRNYTSNFIMVCCLGTKML
jgi:hypothetical protein